METKVLNGVAYKNQIFGRIKEESQLLQPVWKKDWG